MPPPPFPYRLAAIDLDDTLLGLDKKIGAANAAAVQQLRENGVRVVLASGRRRENMLRFHRALGLEPDGLIVSCHGAVVGTADGASILHRHSVPAEIAGELVRAGRAAGLSVVFYDDGGTYADRSDAYTATYEQRTETTLSMVDDLRAFEGVAPQKLLWVGPPERLASLQPGLAARWEGRLEVTVTDPEYLEFMAWGANKAEGMAVAARYYGLGAAQTLAFGDGNNDVAMLRWAGCGVAMDGGRESARAAADWVSPPGDAESSLARAIGIVLPSAISAVLPKAEL